jgi:hypothetical protein
MGKRHATVATRELNVDYIYTKTSSMNIEAKQELLRQYRANLEKLERRIAKEGGYNYAPLNIQNQYDETLEEIIRIEKEIESIRQVSPTNIKILFEDDTEINNGMILHRINSRHFILKSIRNFFKRNLYMILGFIFAVILILLAEFTLAPRSRLSLLLEATTTTEVERTITPTTSVTPKNLTVRVETVNMRLAPSTSSKIVTVLYKGQQVVWYEEVQFSEGRLWFKVRFNSNEGWVDSLFFESPGISP